jgi:hemoglobin-like flavoprotein
LTPEEKQLVHQLLARIEAVGDRLSDRFYTCLFEANPHLRPLFLGGMKYQRVKFIDMLRTLGENLERQDRLVASVWQLGKRHAGYGVRNEHYDLVGAALMLALQTELGSEFTKEARLAWVSFYELIATAMKQAAAEGSLPRA